jgi:hypothetical protein
MGGRFGMVQSVPVLATIAVKGGGFIAQVKARPVTTPMGIRA